MTSLIEQLREETRDLHQQTENLLYADALRAGTLSENQYVHLLRTHGVYHQALEKAIDKHPLFFRDYEPDKRRKTPWIRADLAPFQLPLPTRSALFADWSPAELLGAAYVGEGSMLGGKTVWHYLQQSPAILPLLEHARFYRGYGAETGSQWRAFNAFIGQQPVDPALVVSSAKRAFLGYQHLFQQIQLATSLSGGEQTG